MFGGVDSGGSLCGVGFFGGVVVVGVFCGYWFVVLWCYGGIGCVVMMVIVGDCVWCVDLGFVYVYVLVFVWYFFYLWFYY